MRLKLSTNIFHDDVGFEDFTNEEYAMLEGLFRRIAKDEIPIKVAGLYFTNQKDEIIAIAEMVRADG